MKLFLRTHWKTVVVFALLLGIFLANAFHERYPDEFDSIVGGKYLLQGRLPYRDWFQHHQPGAYVLAAILLPAAHGSFVRFRVLSAVAYFAIVAGSYFLIRKRTNKIGMRGFLLFAFTLALAGTYYWGQMLLADTLAAYLFIPAYLLLLYKDFYRERFERIDLLLVTLFAFLVWFTSMTYLYALAGIILYAMYLYAKSEREHKSSWKKILIDMGVTVGTPYILWFLFLLLTGSLKDYYFANVVYNQEYYIFNYPRAPGAHFNPIRYAVIIANDFVNNYLPALWGALQFPIGDPMQVTLAVSDAVFFVVLIMTGRLTFIFPFLLSLIYSCARGNPQQIKETDYWASVYIVFSFINGVFALAALTDILNKAKETVSNRVIAGALLLVLWVYWLFMPANMFLRMEDKYFPKYMGQLPLIYDRPQVAPMVNALVSPNDYAWIGPFDFEELFYLKTKIPSKYHWFLDPAAKSKIKDEMVADFNRTMPKVVVFRRNYAPWGGESRSFNYFMQDFLDAHYFRIYLLNGTLKDYQYKWKVGNTANFDIDGDFNFLKSDQDALLAKLISLGYLEKVPKK